MYINKNLTSFLDPFIYVRSLIFTIGRSQWQKQMLKSKGSIERGRRGKGKEKANKAL